MNLSKKITQVYQCVENFKKNTDNNTRQFIDIVFPIAYQKNNGLLNISVGKKKTDHFVSFLSSSTKTYEINVTVFDNELVLLFKDSVTHTTLLMVNLTLINNMTVYYSPTCNKYTITFNYNNEIDYEINLMVH